MNPQVADCRVASFARDNSGVVEGSVFGPLCFISENMY